MHLLTASALLLVSSAVSAGTPLPDGPHLVVSGEGKVSVKPDSARTVLAFVDRAPQPLPAKMAVDRDVNALLDGTAAFAIAENDIRASDLSLSEDVDYDDKDQRISRGHVAERRVTVVLKQLDRLNEFLDTALRLGADDIAGVEFESTRADSLRAQAKRDAVAVARRKGEEMATAFGARLGAVYSIDSINSRQASGYGGTTLDRVVVTGSRIGGRYLQPSVDYTESVSVVFNLVP